MGLFRMTKKGRKEKNGAMVVVFVAGTIYHGIAVIRFIVWQFIQSPFILGSLVQKNDVTELNLLDDERS